MRSPNWTFFYIAIELILCPVQVKDQKVEESHSTSVAGMVNLVVLEAKLIENLSSYADELEKKLKILNSVVPRLQAESEKAMNQMQHYISNPLNAFSLIRRMHEDWIDWKAFIEEPVGWSQVDYLDQHKAQLPSQNDVKEACQAIHRLYDVYNLEIEDMAKGLLNGKQYDCCLNALDSYVMGQYLEQHQNHYLAMKWYAETSKWLMEHTLPTPIGAEPQKMIHTFARAFAKNNHYSIALPLFNRAFELGNSTSDAQLLNVRTIMEKMAGEEPEVKPSTERLNTLYSKGCRGLFVPKSNLHCQYKFKTSPFLRLAPLKMEVVIENPFTVLFHDALSPREINELQEMALPLLQRTTVHMNGNDVRRKTRTSKGAWLAHDLNDLTKRIDRRIRDMTELNLDGSESLQVMNYGLGGHYAAHFDFFNTSMYQESETGDRIATVLFYLTDVEQGGATVFPNLKYAVRPESGMALFWYNLHDDGTGNEETLHGGCPVLVGSKWVMTQWIREREQLFARPCLKRV